MAKHNFFEGIWKFTLKDKDGNVKWEHTQRNDLADEGESLMLDSFFLGQNSPTAFYLRMCNDTLTPTSTLSSVTTEPTTSGYSATLIERSTTGWPTLEYTGGDWRVESKLVTFTAALGDIGPVSLAFLATSSDSSGKLICYVSFPVARTIMSGDSMDVQIGIRLQ